MHAGVLDVFFDLGLAVKVRDVGQAAVGDLCDVDQRGEDDVLDSLFFGGIGDILALGDLDAWGGVLPVVCHEEDGVRAPDRLGD